ncbi:hypothetical protein [Bdellovibrio svalbardensis]|uniref:Uncharacterized protein n=1 Tax=Bdellovibrio svalbardensis TaxID=2972972 RepID=A0ABT6DHQ7_9BACT|nr:hypothetical protein [Bdellovibrio svalbardensis]MDG0816390.1 hypothetical protein [Bdellovibrio svalbardensis]
MAAITKFLKILVVFVILGVIAWAVIENYSVIFSKSIKGEITAVERVELPVALIARAGGDINEKVFSFAIGIKDLKTGEIYTASSEDRQWAVAQKGQCAEAVFLPYPPWKFTKRDTFFGARLVRLFECPPK